MCGAAVLQHGTGTDTCPAVSIEAKASMAVRASIECPLQAIHGESEASFGLCVCSFLVEELIVELAGQHDCDHWPDDKPNIALRSRDGNITRAPCVGCASCTRQRCAEEFRQDLPARWLQRHGCTDRFKLVVTGAEVVGSEDLIEAIQRGGAGAINFDKCLATAPMMSRLARIARTLGPRGLMPNPKLGTIVEPAGIAEAVRTMKAGRVEFR